MWRKFGGGGNTNQGAVSEDHQPGDYEDQHKLKHKETQSSTIWICCHMNTEKAGALIVSAYILGMNKLMLYSVWLPFQLT